MNDMTNDDGEQLATKDGINWLNKKGHVRTACIASLVCMVSTGIVGSIAIAHSQGVAWYFAAMFYTGGILLQFLAASHQKRGYAHALFNMTFGRVDAFHIENTVSDYE